jgi:hypothetical protein
MGILEDWGCEEHDIRGNGDMNGMDWDMRHGYVSLVKPTTQARTQEYI